MIEYETIVNEANEKSYALEYDIFIDVRNKTNEHLNLIAQKGKSNFYNRC
ncbi:hypothetical protein [Brachyspira hyodysenteriae]|nr:hypothetical protein [Brachyspira hyodysenteriae]MCZ9966155.1 hypothetical protein [Brachyspira hyodysenteriae]